MEGVETVAQLKAKKRAELEENKKNEERRTYLSKLIDEITAKSELDVASEIIENQIRSRREDLEKRMTQSGLTVEQYLQIIGQTQEQFDEQLKGDAERDVRRYFVLDAIREAEKIDIDDKELEFEFAKMADQYGMKIEDIKKALANQMDAFKNEMINRRVEEFLLANNE